MPQKNDGGNAFPQLLDLRNGFHGCEGMSLRDYFAGQIVAGMMADPGSSSVAMRQAEQQFVPPSLALARAAYSIADAMLVARAEGGGD